MSDWRGSSEGLSQHRTSLYSAPLGYKKINPSVSGIQEEVLVRFLDSNLKNFTLLKFNKDLVTAIVFFMQSLPWVTGKLMLVRGIFLGKEDR